MPLVEINKGKQLLTGSQTEGNINEALVKFIELPLTSIDLETAAQQQQLNNNGSSAKKEIKLKRSDSLWRKLFLSKKKS